MFGERRGGGCEEYLVGTLPSMMKETPDIRKSENISKSLVWIGSLSTQV